MFWEQSASGCKAYSEKTLSLWMKTCRRHVSKDHRLTKLFLPLSYNWPLDKNVILLNLTQIQSRWVRLLVLLCVNLQGNSSVHHSWLSVNTYVKTSSGIRHKYYIQRGWFLSMSSLSGWISQVTPPFDLLWGLNCRKNEEVTNCKMGIELTVNEYNPIKLPAWSEISDVGQN